MCPFGGSSNRFVVWYKYTFWSSMADTTVIKKNRNFHRIYAFLIRLGDCTFFDSRTVVVFLAYTLSVGVFLFKSYI